MTWKLGMDYFQFWTLLFCGTSFAWVAPNDKGSCYIDIANLKSKYAPLVLQEVDGGFEALMPSLIKHGHIFMNIANNSTKTVSLACPGEDNELDTFGRFILQTECSENLHENNSIFHLNGRDYNAHFVTCFDDLVPYEKETGVKCFNGEGEIYDIGFQVGTEIFVRLYRICYNKEFGFSHYAEHTIMGFPGFPQHQETLVKKFTVSNPSIAHKLVIMRSFMSRNAQVKHLSSTLGEELTNKYLRGHSNQFTGFAMAPHADFLITSHQLATHVFANLHYIWRPRDSIWRTVESEVRLLARKGGIKVITGVYKMAEVHNQKLFMGPRKTLPLHSYFWKFVAYPKSNACVLFIMENIVPDGIIKPKCKLSCRQNGWLKNIKWEYLVPTSFFCCSPEEMKTAIPHLPHKHNCSIVLKNEGL